MKVTCLVLILLMCNACTSYYKPSANTATVDIELYTVEYPVVVQVFKNAQCENFKNGIQLAAIHPQLGDPLQGIVKTIDANKRTILSFKKQPGGAQNSGFSCTTSVSFVPRSGEVYRALFTIKRKRCLLSIHRKVLDDEKIHYELDNSTTILLKKCFDGFSG